MRLARPFAVALALALLSGAAALAHQLLWTRRLVDALGANADTFSKVIGAFFIGLALGAWLSSRTAAAHDRWWRRVAFAEIAVAALAMPMLCSAAFTDWIAARGAHGPWLKWLLPPLLILPPATAMGLVIPWMIRALAAGGGFSPRQAVWLYAVNTLGGVLGIGSVVLALPRLGLTGASLAAIASNALVAGGALALDLWRRRPATDGDRAGSERRSDSRVGPTGDEALPPPARAEPSNSVRRTWHSSLAFASGFLVLALEVVLQHQLAQVTINSLFSSALVLVLVLLALTGAAFLAPWLLGRLGDAGRALRLALALAAILCAAQPFLLTGLRDGLAILPYELPPLAYIGRVLQIGLPAIGPTMLAAGLVFPLLLRVVAGQEDRRGVGLLFFWNGLGGWLGAELAAGWIAPAFGLWTSVSLLATVYAALRLIFDANWTSRTVATPLVRGLALRNAWAVLLLAAVLASLPLTRSLPQASVAPGERLAALAVGREGVVATLECGPGDWRMLFNNSYTLGGSKAQFNQERQGLLPLLLHGDPKTIALLGVATGGSVAGVALHPLVEHIDAVELSPLVLRQADEFFTPFNRAVFRDPRVAWLQEDARWVMAGRPGHYDVVIGDLFLPWRTGEGRLFTREHFVNVRRALRPGGVFCQWLPLFQLTRPQFEGIARTFREVFPDAFLVRGDFYSELPVLGLVGGRDGAGLDWPLIAANCARLRAAGDATDPLVRHAEGVAMMLIGPLPAPPAGPVNTLANAWLEWDAGRNILGLPVPWFIGVPCAEYVRDVHRRGQPWLPEALRPAHDSGQFFLTLEIAAKLNLPALEAMKLQMPARMPAALRNDRTADWRQWPMRLKPDKF